MSQVCCRCFYYNEQTWSHLIPGVAALGTVSAANGMVKVTGDYTAFARMATTGFMCVSNRTGEVKVDKYSQCVLLALFIACKYKS